MFSGKNKARLRIPDWAFFGILFVPALISVVRHPTIFSVAAFIATLALLAWIKFRPLGPTTSRRLYGGLIAVGATYCALLGTTAYLFFNGANIWVATLTNVVILFCGFFLWRVILSGVKLARLVALRENQQTS